MDNASYRSFLCEWFHTPLGQRLMQAEAAQLQNMLTGIYAPLAVQIGTASLPGVVEEVSTSLCVVMGCPPLPPWLARLVQPSPTSQSQRPARGAPLFVHCRAEQLPLGRHTAGFIVMPHTLDVSDEPGAVLREASEVLDDDGYLALSGFNPLGLWAWLNLFQPRACRPPRWRCHYRLHRVQEWLALLGFELTGAAMVHYRPPLSDEALSRKLLFMETAGARWWPFAAAAYILVARKKIYATPPPWRARPYKNRLQKPLAQPATRATRSPTS